MIKDLLRRELAPIVPEAWDEIDREARRVLALNLTGRKLVDLDGPHGWSHAAKNLGTLEVPLAATLEGVEARLRRVMPLVEMRVPFRLDLEDLDGAARGASTFDMAPIVEAAERVARAEDGAIFNGFAGAGITGIRQASPHPAVSIPADTRKLPEALLAAAEVLRESGIDGPYALALSNDLYKRVSTATESGYPIRKRIEQQVLDGPLVWAPAVEGALLLSMRGGDFVLTVGQDLSVGYAAHDRESVELYLTESFTFAVLDEAAAVPLSGQTGG